MVNVHWPLHVCPLQLDEARLDLPFCRGSLTADRARCPPRHRPPRPLRLHATRNEQSFDCQTSHTCCSAVSARVRSRASAPTTCAATRLLRQRFPGVS